MNKLIEFTLQGKPLTVNKAYNNGPGNSRVKSALYNEFEYNMTEQLRDLDIDPDLGLKDMQPLFVFYKFYFPIYKKRTKILSQRAGDTSNLIKPFEDVMSYYFGFDDSQIVGFLPLKLHSEKCFTHVEIFKVDDYDEECVKWVY